MLKLLFCGLALLSLANADSGCTAIVSGGTGGGSFTSSCSGTVSSGSTCLLTCSAKGYIGSVTRTCNSNGAFDSTDGPTCTATFCDPIVSGGSLSNTFTSSCVSGTTVSTGSTCALTCNAPGYSGTATRTCTNGQFDFVAGPTCVPRPCVGIAGGGNNVGRYTSSCPSGTVHGQSCTLACSFSGYTGKLEKLCTAGNYNGGSNPTCSPNPCDPIPNDPMFTSACATDSVASGSSCVLTCAAGYSGSLKKTCTAGDWDGAAAPTCSPGSCSLLSSGGLGETRYSSSCANGKAVSSGSTCTLTCTAPGYSGSVVKLCTATQYSGPDAPTCSRNPCAAVADGGSGTDAYTSSCAGGTTASGSSCTLSCSAPGYTGSVTAQCLTGNFISLSAPQCNANPCAAIASGGSGNQAFTSSCSGSGTAHGASCTLTCTKNGYPGSLVKTCNAGVYSGGSAPICSAITCDALPAANAGTVNAYSSSCSGGSNPSGSSCTLTCTASGYSGSLTRLCTAGVFDGASAPTCIPDVCPPLPGGGSGSSAYTSSCASADTPNGASCTLSCTGGGWSGSVVKLCTAGQYSGASAPTCNGNTCDPLPNQALFTSACANSRTDHGQSCTLSCIAGYSGSLVKNCRAGNFDGASEPTCLAHVNCVGKWTTDSCPVTCGGASVTSRFTITIQPENGGTPCPSVQTQTVTCGTGTCPPSQDCVGSWVTPDCPVTCGTAHIISTYGVTVPALNGGVECSANNKDTEEVTCGTSVCPVDCVGAWMSSSACSAACGAGTISQVYSISTPAAGGSACPAFSGQTRSIGCSGTDCAEGVSALTCSALAACYTCSRSGSSVTVDLSACKGSSLSWACMRGIAGNSLNSCDRSRTGNTCEELTQATWTVPTYVNLVTLQVHDGQICGDITGNGIDTQGITAGTTCGGTGTSQKSCVSGVCNVDVDLTNCAGSTPPPPTPAPVDCVGEWTTPGCPVSCGGASVTSTFAVYTPAANGGAACPFPREILSTCGNDACPVSVDCTGHWEVDECPVTCGKGNVEHRYVVDKQPKNKGQSCPSNFISECNADPCPAPKIDCEATFTDSECSATCGGGLITRTYTVIVPPQNGGSLCPATRTLDCATNACPTSVCTDTINDGDRDCCLLTGLCKSSSCTVFGYPESAATVCSGRRCAPAVCTYVKPGCTAQGNNRCYGYVTCSDGTTNCDYYGEVCLDNGNSANFKICGAPDPIDCEGHFEESVCSTTCGRGTKTRSHVVTRQPHYGGQACPPSETLECENAECPESSKDCEGTWTYGECSVTCGVGSYLSTFEPRQHPTGNGHACPISPITTECVEASCVDVECTAWINEGDRRCCAATGVCQDSSCNIFGFENKGDLCNPDSNHPDCVNSYCKFALDGCISYGTNHCYGSIACVDGTQDCLDFGELCVETDSGSFRICELDDDVDCAGYWESGPCSSTCGEGTATKTFIVTTEPQHGGQLCPIVQQRKETCNADAPCDEPPKVDCAGFWDSPPCSVSCGKGFRTLTFTVTDTPSNHGGKCPASPVTEDCNVGKCPESCKDLINGEYRECCPATGTCQDSSCTVFGFKNSARTNCPGAHGDCAGSYCDYVVDGCMDSGNGQNREHCYGYVACTDGSSDCYGHGSPCLEDGSSDNFKICGDDAPRPRKVNCKGTWVEYPCTATCGEGTIWRHFEIEEEASNGGTPCDEDVVYGCHLRDCPTHPPRPHSKCPPGHVEKWGKCFLACGDDSHDQSNDEEDHQSNDEDDNQNNDADAKDNN